ncbi:MAG: DNA replication/repair protein RecF [Rhodospirillaceae bacterium]|nr:DNA replication/repair protein RecF [Rhodospirillaceae bacterium]
MTALTDTVRPEITTSPIGAAAFGIVRLMLTDFRNYEHLRLELDPRPVVLAGHNGAGKTNILEALSYLSAGRGLRSAKLSDVGRRGVDETEGRPWAVAGELETASGSIRLGSGIDPSSPDRRSVHIDGKAAKGAAALAPHLSAVWVTPSMDRLFTDTPGGRRRFLDRLVSVLDTQHPSRVAAFDNANRRRARLFRDGVSDGSWFNALEDTLARYGVAIAAARRDTVARLNGVLADEDGPFPSAQLGLSGIIDAWLDTMAAVDAEEALRQALVEDRKAWSGDREPPVSQGPNRSDLAVVYAGTGRSAADCSTGEQKALLISIILAHVRLQTARRGQPPLLLLDEVAAHLDPERRHHLFERITSAGIQAWLTGTEISMFAEFGNKVQMFTVADGQISSAVSATVLSHPKLAPAGNRVRPDVRQ